MRSHPKHPGGNLIRTLNHTYEMKSKIWMLDVQDSYPLSIILNYICAYLVSICLILDITDFISDVLACLPTPSRC